tara:strand:- start:1412 stop:1567 length:156 start_codon:yes stop_codon:yes gene_type:complete
MTQDEKILNDIFNTDLGKTLIVEPVKKELKELKKCGWTLKEVQEIAKIITK